MSILVRGLAIFLFVSVPFFALANPELLESCKKHCATEYMCPPGSNSCTYEQGICVRICIMSPSAQDRAQWDGILQRMDKGQCVALFGQLVDDRCRLKGVKANQTTRDLLFEPPLKAACEANEGRWDGGRCRYFCDDNPGAVVPNSGGYRCGLE